MLKMTFKDIEQIWFNGNINTLEQKKPFASAIATANGKIVAIGSDEDILHLKQPNTKVFNFENKYVMPGLVESHTHALWGSCKRLFDISIDFSSSLDNLLDEVRKKTNEVCYSTIIVGGPWRLDMMNSISNNPRKILDEVSPNHAVVLEDTTQHNVWCNSKMIELVGIENLDRDFLDGFSGRDSKGFLNGIFSEGACKPIRERMVRTTEQLSKASDYLVKHLNELGFTSFKEPMAEEENLKAYKEKDDLGELTLHMAAHIAKISPLSIGEISFSDLERLRKKYRSENIRTDYAKLFLDGVAPSFTASFFSPYTLESGYDISNHNPKDTLLIETDYLNKTLEELDKRGFTTKIHAVGDYAIHTALNAIENARMKNGYSGLRHEISHCPFIKNDDIGRFKSLDVVAEVSPKLWFPNAMTKAQIHVLGNERVQGCHPIKSLLHAGAEVIYGSDWPAGTPDANPWIGLAGMISRKDPNNFFEGHVGKNEAISIKQALPIFTKNGAKSLGMENETGTISNGKWADFIVLNNSIETQSINEIANIKVQKTVWKGKTVYSEY